MRRLPRSVDELRGLRAARWLRESKAGQFDAFGPESQRELQDRAVERLGLVETGIEWSVAHSGRTVGTTAQFVAMMAAAGVSFDVLIVGYVSRFARDLETAVPARKAMHERGAVILFCDENIVTSDVDAWERWAQAAVEAEAYSHRLAKRVSQAYAAKRRRLGIPGGNRPPLGTVREGRTIRVDETLALVRHAYELAGAGQTDRDVSAATGLRLKHVAEILTSRFYIGELSDGSPSVLGELVDRRLWERVQALRSRYSRRHRGATRRRHYSLTGILACAACGRRLVGHNGRIRHVEACEPFRAAVSRPARAFRRGGDRRVRGDSYRAELYDEAIEQAFARVAVGGRTMADTVALATKPEPVKADVLAHARIERERDAAALRFARDRDLPMLEATMARLDAQAERSAEATVPLPTAAEARAYLEDLPRLWRETDADGRRAIAEAVFERIDVLGVTDYTIHPTAEAVALGWADAFGPEFTCSIGRSGRGGRTRASGNELSATIRVAGPRRLHRVERSA